VRGDRGGNKQTESPTRNIDRFRNFSQCMKFSGRAGSFRGVAQIPGVVMSEIQEAHSAHRLGLVRPVCVACRAPMVLVRLRPSNHGSYRGKYVCEVCSQTVIDDVKLTRLEASKTA